MLCELASRYRPRMRAAEFFAGIGLVRLALEQHGFEVIFANDIEPVKHSLYAANFPDDHFALGDVRALGGDNIPDIDLATASFPCTDLSLAGNRAGLNGAESSMFWEFARILEEMGDRRPRAVLLENVVGFASSHGGADLRSVVRELNRLGYSCDAFVVNAKQFVPQSRPRLFIVGSLAVVPGAESWTKSALRPEVLHRALGGASLDLHAFPIDLPVEADLKLGDVVERLSPDDSRWWGAERVEAFIGSLSPLQGGRLTEMMDSKRTVWAAAYRRTRGGNAVWEIRGDALSGCLRTARGGSSKQALVEAGRGRVRIRWMTAREYARLQGAPDFEIDSVTETQALYGFGDAVCVPVIAWIAREYLAPLLQTPAYA